MKKKCPKKCATCGNNPKKKATLGFLGIIPDQLFGGYWTIPRPLLVRVVRNLNSLPPACSLGFTNLTV